MLAETISDNLLLKKLSSSKLSCEAKSSQTVAQCIHLDANAPLFLIYSKLMTPQANIQLKVLVKHTMQNNVGQAFCL